MAQQIKRGKLQLRSEKKVLKISKLTLSLVPGKGGGEQEEGRGLTQCYCELQRGQHSVHTTFVHWEIKQSGDSFYCDTYYTAVAWN